MAQHALEFDCSSGYARLKKRASEVKADVRPNPEFAALNVATCECFAKLHASATPQNIAVNKDSPTNGQCL
jgi:hypothetical protein